MDDKIKELMADLPAELQEQLKAASTQEEALAILEKHAIPLPDDALESVAGGEWTWTQAMSCGAI
ncbi:MAG: hypothetical protein PUD96_05250 [Coriobacteriaceae bacterium]|nr:hypothetical protein [Coriobacteriaceae bacterium]MDD6769186.1 hypothetical protein [Coriobacteriaceae bacterium]